ncbi:hypothetical protein BZL29_3663 [Mycobacterium kansasii]|uniref:Uncharacterized protein n=1 Tax=Mycobacterium kansasii TaxID=1768 RepID=A0A1V3XEF1_MYCKA|nr:hypothetical protein BZL29_3663 [Mycobacterium kansasii]
MDPGQLPSSRTGDVAYAKRSGTRRRDRCRGGAFRDLQLCVGLHTVEYYTAGTAVRRTGSGETITPSFVLPMDN